LGGAACGFAGANAIAREGAASDLRFAGLYLLTAALVSVVDRLLLITDSDGCSGDGGVALLTGAVAVVGLAVGMRVDGARDAVGVQSLGDEAKILEGLRK